MPGHSALEQPVRRAVANGSFFPSYAHSITEVENPPPWYDSCKNFKARRFAKIALEVGMTAWPQELNHYKLRQFPALYTTLALPDIPSLVGPFRGIFIGPGWLRVVAPPGLVVSGLGGWWGKYFQGDGSAINLVRRKGVLEKRLPMSLIQAPSMIDGKPGLGLHYVSENPFPWPYFVDEIRQLDADTLLGMMCAKPRLLGGLALPFLLIHQEKVDGL
jgi:hypothetical protein